MISPRRPAIIVAAELQIRDPADPHHINLNPGPDNG